jgi:hypothetical protein
MDVNTTGRQAAYASRRISMHSMAMYLELQKQLWNQGHCNISGIEEDI